MEENVETEETGKNDDEIAVTFSQPNEKGLFEFYISKSFPS